MDASTLLLCALGVVTALLLLLERWAGSRGARATPHTASLRPQHQSKPAVMMHETVPALVLRQPKSAAMMHETVPAAVMCSVEVRAVRCGPLGTDGTSRPSAEIKEDEGDAPDNV